MSGEKRTYWHGGQSGLRAGGYIVPPDESGARHTLADYGTVAGRVARRDRVYVTTDPDAALLYAVMHPSRGTVYEVEPVGGVVPDPDCSKPGLSWECERALIVSVWPVSRKTREHVIASVVSP